MTREWIVILTSSSFLSEGPRNYILRLINFMLQIGIPVKARIIYGRSTPILILNIFLNIIRSGASRKVFILPYVRWEELMALILVLPLLSLARSKVLVISHDVHGLYRKPGLFWRLLILLRSARLACLPSVYIVYVSTYSMLETLKLTETRCITGKGFILYPILKHELEPIKRDVFSDKTILLFSKISKMLNDSLWDVLSKCLTKELNMRIKEFIVMGKGSQQEVEKLVATLKRHNIMSMPWVKLMLNVSNEVRDRVLEKAYIMVYPESTEGLGMPCFEATMKGVPILSARQTALIEFVDPGLYNLRTIRYPDFCKALIKALEANPKDLFKASSSIRSRILKTTLLELRRLLKVIESS